MHARLGPRTTSCSKGFTLVEVVLVLGLSLLLGTLIVPAVAGELDRARASSAVETLTNLAAAIHDPTRGSGSFRGHVGRYPSTLSQLTQAVTDLDMNSCNAAFTALEAAGWSGPYVNRTVTSNGIPVGIGTVQNDLVRVAGTNPLLKILVHDVTVLDAQEVDRRVDGTEDSAAGTIRWGTPDAENLVTMEYVLPVKGC